MTNQRITDGKRLINGGKVAIHDDCCCDACCTYSTPANVQVIFSNISSCGVATDDGYDCDDCECGDVNGTYVLPYDLDGVDANGHYCQYIDNFSCGVGTITAGVKLYATGRVQPWISITTAPGGTCFYGYVMTGGDACEEIDDPYVDVGPWACATEEDRCYWGGAYNSNARVSWYS